jgi:hypothetical protein
MLSRKFKPTLIIRFDESIEPLKLSELYASSIKVK